MFIHRSNLSKRVFREILSIKVSCANSRQIELYILNIGVYGYLSLTYILIHLCYKLK